MSKGYVTVIEMDETLLSKICPDCFGLNLVKRSDNYYVCEDCGANFDEDDIIG